MNASGAFGEAVTVNVQVKPPVAFVLHDPAVNVTASGWTAAKVIPWLATKPVPLPVRVWGKVMGPIGANDQEGVAVNVEVVVTPSTVNDSAVFGAAITEIEHVSVPYASVLHATTVKVTADSATGAASTAGEDSLGAKPVPVAESV